MTGAIWKLLLIDLTGILVVLQQALQGPMTYPHPELVVPALWSLVGTLGVLILVMVRLWYRDFCGWRDQMTRDISELKAGMASQGTAIEAVTQEFRGRIDTLESNLYLHDQKDAPQTKKRRKR